MAADYSIAVESADADRAENEANDEVLQSLRCVQQINGLQCG